MKMMQAIYGSPPFQVLRGMTVTQTDLSTITPGTDITLKNLIHGASLKTKGVISG
jgi:hypothetical protein